MAGTRSQEQREASPEAPSISSEHTALVGRRVRVLNSKGVLQGEGWCTQVTKEETVGKGGKKGRSVEVLLLLHDDALIRQWSTAQKSLVFEKLEDDADPKSTEEMDSMMKAQRWYGGSAHARQLLTSGELHDQEIEVWWSAERQWFDGVVKSTDITLNPDSSADHPCVACEVLYNDGDVEVINMRTEVWRTAAEAAAQVEADSEEVIVESVQDCHMSMTRFRDTKGRLRIRAYIDTGQPLGEDEAELSFKSSNLGAVITVEPRDETKPITTYCIVLPCPVHAHGEKTAKHLPRSGGMVESTVDPWGRARLTFFAVEDESD